MYTLSSLSRHRAGLQQSLRAARCCCSPWLGAESAKTVRPRKLGPKFQSCGLKFQKSAGIAAPESAVTRTALQSSGRNCCQGNSIQRRHQTVRDTKTRSTLRNAEASLAPPPYEPTADERRQFDVFVAFLLEESQKYNLTGAKTAEELNSRHVEDCLALLPVIDMAAAAAEQSRAQDSTGSLSADSPTDEAKKKTTTRVLDIGSGAGLPGLLLAICRPHWQVVMLDSLRKRTIFLNAAVERLQLTNATALWARAEDAGNDPQHRESYEVVTARAVADMRVLAELTIPFLRLGGQLAVAKGALPQEEVASAAYAIKELGGADADIIPVASHGPKGQRTAVRVAKVARTSSRYPRPPKQISRGPL